MDGVIFYKQCDITKKDQMDKLLRSTIVQKLHFIDIFVNAAGIINEQNPKQVVAVNLTGVINSSLIALDIMSLENAGLGGYIVNLASTAGLEPFPYCSVYTSTKHAIVGFTRSLGVNN